MDKEMAIKLRAALEAMDARIAALEHLVNDTIIGGLKSAAEEYEDDEKFSNFCDNYSEVYSPLEPAAAILYGEDYSLPDDLYEKVKKSEGYGSEGFDEAGTVNNLLSEIQSKIDALEALKDKVEEKAEDNVEEKAEDKEDNEVGSDEEEVEIPSEEDLAKEFDEYSTKN